MLYDTMIGVFGVNTDNYNSKYDFSSDSYKLDPVDALVLHGKKKYIDKGNYIYWQKYNAKYLVDTKQSSRIIPHRVNSIGKLKDIWSDGFRSFEVDVRFGETNPVTFQVGHDDGAMGVGLEEFLDSVDSQELQKFWLDAKNINSDNYEGALSRLEYLDSKYGLKRKLILESTAKSEFFKEFSNNGWHTSYRLPTLPIAGLLADGDRNGMEILSEEISKQVGFQELHAVSFEDSLYPFVKEYLEPKLSEKTVYHIWYAPALSDVDFKKRLLENVLYLDDRIETLLSHYKSQYDL